jgi:hypothetical protein
MNGRPLDLFLESTCSQPPDHDLKFSVCRRRRAAGFSLAFSSASLRSRVTQARRSELAFGPQNRLGS